MPRDPHDERLDEKDIQIKMLMLQIEAYEKELSDADCTALQCANLAQTWCRRLGHKISIIRWPNVRKCAARVVARSEGKYTTPDSREYAGIFNGEGDHE
jgi:hypothetical protein